MTAVRGVEQAAPAAPESPEPSGAGFWVRCHRVARDDGIAPALSLLRDAVLPGLLPCGPAGHAVVPRQVGAVADRGVIWLDGVRVAPTTARRVELGGFGLPGGRVVVLREVPDPVAVPPEAAHARRTVRAESERAAWALGLLWLRLGLSEALRETCLSHLRSRRTGDSVLLQQQLVKGMLAEALAEQLEIRAVLVEAGAGLPGASVDELHLRITMADRAQLHLLGASGYLAGGPGEVGYVSELVADAYRTGERA